MGTAQRIGCGLAVAAAAAGMLPTACVTRASLHEVVLDYDETVGRAQAELLLLNVARAHHRRPLHFTTVSGIAATFDYRADASLGAEVAERPDLSLLIPSLGVSAAENPTISIVPLQGEEFTRRLLAPLDETVLAFFFHQGTDIALLLGLVAQAIVLETDAGRTLLINDPRSATAPRFRALVARLADLARQGRLDAGPLVFAQRWPLPADAGSAAGELADLVERGFELRVAADGARALSRRVVGRHAVTDYDLSTRSDAERRALHERAQQYPGYFVLLDLQPARPGDPSVRGWIKLRSLGAVIGAAARGIGAPPANRPTTLTVLAADAPPGDSLFRVAYEGRYYAVPRDEDGGNATAFDVLYRLYQMSITEPPGGAVPPVTIAK